MDYKSPPDIAASSPRDEYEMKERSDMAGTNKDELDMQRLGRTQQLNVRIVLKQSPKTMMLMPVAQLPLHLDSWVLLHGNEYLGNHTLASPLSHQTPTIGTNYRNSSSLFGLINGGLPGLVWMYLTVWLGYITVFASIAEMSSM